jgi:hypothetical protein
MNIMMLYTDKSSLERLLRLQKHGARLILRRKIRECRSDNLFKVLGWVYLTDRWAFHKCETVFRCLNGFCPSYLSNVLNLNSKVHNYNTRRRNDIHLCKISSRSDLGNDPFPFQLLNCIMICVLLLNLRNLYAALQPTIGYK